MIKFNSPYNDIVEYPISLYDYLASLCRQLGVELANESIINGNYQIQGNPFTNNETNMTVLSNITQLAGGFAKINRDNKLYIVNLNKTQNNENIVETIDGNNYDDTFLKNEIWGEVNCLIIRLSDIKGENITRQDEESINTNGLTELTIADNYFLTDSAQRQIVIEELWNNLKGLKYLPFSTDYYGYPYLDVGDLIEIKDNDDASFYTYIFNHTFKYNGVYSGNIETTAMTKTQTAYKNTSLKDKFKRTEYIVDKINGQITQIVEEVDETGQKVTQIEQNIDGLETEIKDTTNEINEKINNIQQTIDGTQQTLTNKGGNNIFYYAKEFWTDGTEEGTSNLEEYTNTEIQQKSVSGNGYIINEGISEQKQVIKNETYTISFTYRKLIDLATGYIEINGTKYELTSTDWKEEVITEGIDTNTIDFKVVSDTNNAFEIFDLMGAIGNEKQIWTQNPNETRTDTVTIGKGIQVNSSSKNTYARFDADGNRIFNKATGEVVTELTDKGIDTDKVTADEGQIGGVLIQKIDEQTWFSSLL